ncbi:MAG: glycosyltransferase involved in cell wall biosynthesis [Psychroserpens sp.]|jgi:glycosyltransferase involved in cell wall biosynthesis
MEISVLIPVYNAEKHLEKAIKSALEISQVREILLIEDASPDNSLNICERYSSTYDKVKLYRHGDSKNHGAASSRNLGIKLAKYDFIAFLDADDHYLPNRFDQDDLIFNSNKDIDFVYNAVENYLISTNYQEKFPRLMTLKRNVKSSELFSHLIGYGNWIGYFHLNGLTIRRSKLLSKELLFNNSLRLHQDTDFICKLSYSMKSLAGELKFPVAIRNVHLDNRITIRFKNKKIRKKNDILLFESLLKWAIIKNIEPRYINFLRRSVTIRQIVKYNKALRPFMTIFEVIKDHNLVTIDKYYLYIHHSLFGNKKLSEVILTFRKFILRKTNSNAKIAHK